MVLLQSYSITVDGFLPTPQQNCPDYCESITGKKNTLVLPDIATCPNCLREIFDPRNRRYHYPFTNCTHCGPRFSMIKALPYDRLQTTMGQFELCAACEAEYNHPLDRRFHAQPNACPDCGPHLELWDTHGEVLASNHHALLAAVAAIRRGAIVAVKGIGGFHLIVDARNQRAIATLRHRKHRPHKPFALMYPSLALIAAHCDVSPSEVRLLQSPQAPIVLLRKQAKDIVAALVAPDQVCLGIMLPYTPLHHLLMAELGFPVVATSGNLTDEPICTDEHEALGRLGKIADLLLVHNRPIAHPVDDSVVRTIGGRELVLRRARGYAPLPVQLSTQLKVPCEPDTVWQNSNGARGKGQAVKRERQILCELGMAQPNFPPILAVGAQFKNTIALSVGQQVFISQHIGDLGTVLTVDAFQRAIAHLQTLYDVQPAAIACDLHPDYVSTQFAQQFAQQQDIPVIPVQHHYAHVLSCMAEHHLDAPVLGIAWDGTGYGLDGTIWGGEFLYVTERSFQRVAHLRPFCLPGGEQAVKEPRRSALGLLYACYEDEMLAMEHLVALQTFNAQELRVLMTMLRRRLNAPMASSMGRLFDAIAALLGLHHTVSFEGQAAMALESVLQDVNIDAAYPFQIMSGDALTIDWAPMVPAILDDFNQPVTLGHISAKFHNTLVETIIAIAKHVAVENVILTGGCFQNKYLSERAIQRLTAENFRPYWHQRVPPNDGGIALGQIVAALREDNFSSHL
ncbi:MAG: carbamoyltransferase HypF [Cyanothece sp. SIO1E1]|nr:carbamoyltransferase HypF [Cyanothece sp. SIO1E1]